jgi:hypothetical protein
MARFRVSGSGVATPFRDEANLTHVLSELNLSHAIDQAAIHKTYFRLGVIIDKWLAEQGQVEISPVAKKLIWIARNLGKVSQYMSGLETGFQTSFELTLASQVQKYLALDPTVGSLERANELIKSFQQEAARMSHVCMIAHADLSSEAGKDGRRALDWYDDFTLLLLDLAECSDIEPRLGKDRITGMRAGWLVDAAQALETFLYPHMRSPSVEACGKRLERSRKRLKRPARQNSLAR